MATGAAELDPLFVKALGYFWSKSADSTAKLKKMLDDAIEQSNRRQETKTSIDSTKSSAKIIPKHPKTVKVNLAHDQKKKEKELAQKRQFEKLQKDLEELDNDVSKKIRIDPITSSTAGEIKSVDSPSSGIRESPMSTVGDKDFALEIDDGLTCVICSVLSSGPGNTPVECQECHNMYHRECHQPPISYQDANDPRCIWYCARCTKSMKKVAKQNSSKTSASVGKESGRDRFSSAESKNKSSFITPFKRNEINKASLTTSTSGSGGSMSGWAALSGKNIHHPSTTTITQTSKATNIKSSPTSQYKVNVSTPSANPAKDKKDKLTKVPKPSGPKLAVSDAWAEALGAEVPAASGKVTPSAKSGGKSPSWTSGTSSTKPSIFPKTAATSLPHNSKTGVSSEVNAMKRLQMLKKKATSKKKSRI